MRIENVKFLWVRLLENNLELNWPSNTLSIKPSDINPVFWDRLNDGEVLLRNIVVEDFISFLLLIGNGKLTIDGVGNSDFKRFFGFWVVWENDAGRYEGNCRSRTYWSNIQEQSGFLKFDGKCFDLTCLNLDIASDIDSIQAILEFWALNIVAKGFSQDGI